MSTTPDNPPAFPQIGAQLSIKDNIYFLDKGGMTLRDYFAGHALAGLLADSNTSGTYEQFADYAYQYADAMLRVREQKDSI